MTAFVLALLATLATATAVRRGYERRRSRAGGAPAWLSRLERFRAYVADEDPD